MKEYYNLSQGIGRRRCYLNCSVQKSDKSITEFGGAQGNTLGERSGMIWNMRCQRDFFLSGLEDTGIKEKLFDERLATFFDAEKIARDLSDSRLRGV